MPDDLPGLRAMAHPLRLRILSLLTGAAMSAAEIARELAESQPNVSYHLRKLHDAGLVRVAEHVTIRGGQAKRYRHDPDTEAPAPYDRDRNDDLMLVEALATELRRRTAVRRVDRRGHYTDAELWVEPEVWAEALGTIREASKRLHEAAKPPRTPGTVRTGTTVAMFEMAES